MPSQLLTPRGSFALEPQERLLDALERTGHKLEYQCRQGYCGACRLILKRGQVQYPASPLASLATREILPCCCYAQGEIELDLPTERTLSPA